MPSRDVRPDYRDIEQLVSEIKENLRLSGLKTKPPKRVIRPSPYSNPSRSLSETTECASPDDPYQMLQHLLRDGDLIKEAVRRLQKCVSPKQYNYDSEDDRPFYVNV